MVDVYDDAQDDCILRGTDNMQMRFASGRPHASICQGKYPVGPSRFIHVEQSRDARRAPNDSRPPRTEPRRGRGRDPGDVSLSHCEWNRDVCFGSKADLWRGAANVR